MRNKKSTFLKGAFIYQVYSFFYLNRLLVFHTIAEVFPNTLVEIPSLLFLAVLLNCVFIILIFQIDRTKINGSFSVEYIIFGMFLYYINLKKTNTTIFRIF